MAMACLLLTPACQRPDEGRAVLGLEQALQDMRASLAVIGMPIAPEAKNSVQMGALPPPPSALAPRRAGGQPPATAVTLQGRAREDVMSALGEPALRRREGDAEVWLYQAADCRLDMVFYPEAGTLVLAYAAARASGARRLTEAACLAAIAAAPNPPPWTLADRVGRD